jgi:hypothetical protein
MQPPYHDRNITQNVSLLSGAELRFTKGDSQCPTNSAALCCRFRPLLQSAACQTLNTGLCRSQNTPRLDQQTSSEYPDRTQNCTASDERRRRYEFNLQQIASPPTQSATARSHRDQTPRKAVREPSLEQPSQPVRSTRHPVAPRRSNICSENTSKHQHSPTRSSKASM